MDNLELLYGIISLALWAGGVAWFLNALTLLN